LGENRSFQKRNKEFHLSRCGILSGTSGTSYSKSSPNCDPWWTGYRITGRLT